ncbi:TetR/AcrR family transcriptional regulator [Rhodococcus sp. T7]|uniref:TetR/AcrR family transcriptional regulator n=1 Tax=Rhodococcus sp. T7 TaxID=627444 RepID=UPI00135BEFF9|nr:TetR/AcrR family transcriptional regulator [Rhodococcus sp. T7]
MESADMSPIQIVRKTHGESRDPRVPRTRAKIFDAVESLVARNEEPISVPAIVREAGISKTSFYSHFASFDELALQIVERAYLQLAEINEAVRSDSTLEWPAQVRESHEQLVGHYVEHRSLYVAVLALPLSRKVHTRAVRSMAADIEPGIVDNPRRPPGLRPHLAASMIASAVVGFLDEWLEDDFDATPEELVEHIMELLPAWYTGRDCESRG